MPVLYACLASAGTDLPALLPGYGRRLLCLYLLAMNLAAFWAFGSDKRRARQKRRRPSISRISEETLFLLSALGGGGGAWLAMLVFRHKIRKRSFRICIPLFTLIWAAAAGLFLWRRTGG